MRPLNLGEPKIKIEKGIPLPDHKIRHQTESIYPFKEMEVGDSFYIPTTDRGKSATRSNMEATICRWIVRNDSKWRFKALEVERGVRVWRVK